MIRKLTRTANPLRSPSSLLLSLIAHLLGQPFLEAFPDLFVGNDLTAFDVRQPFIDASQKTDAFLNIFPRHRVREFLNRPPSRVLASQTFSMLRPARSGKHIQLYLRKHVRLCFVEVSARGRGSSLPPGHVIARSAATKQSQRRAGEIASLHSQ
jgi:hypothetical protein